MVAQQLIRDKNGSGRHGVFEILLNSPRVSDLIRRGELHELKATMAKSKEIGMQTFDQALLKLYTDGEISYADALHHADSPNDLRLMIKLQSSDPTSSSSMDGVTLNLD